MSTTSSEPKICIIGAGPTGLGAAYRLNELGSSNYNVFEMTDHVGGLAASIQDDRGYTWDFAVHVLHSHYTYFDRAMEAALPGGYYTHERRSWVRMEGRYVPYPFQYNIRYLSQETLWDCVDGLLDIHNGNDETTPENFREWMIQNSGAGIAKHFMIPYNSKIWTVDPAQMGYQWIGERVPKADARRVIRNVVQDQDDVAWGPNHTFQFPKEGGTGAIWEGIADCIPSERIHLEHEVVRIDTDAKCVYFSNGRAEPYDHLISTLPIPELARLCEWDDLAELARPLKHSHVYVVGVALDYKIPEPLKDKTWLYCPGDECMFYRVTPFSIFSPAHVPDPEKNCSMLCEISVPAGETRDPDTLRRAACEGLVRSGLLPEVPDDVHTVLMDATYGYPIPTIDRDDVLKNVDDALTAKNILSRGRFGGWKYEVANMDHTFMQGVEAVDRIINGTPERTWPDPAGVNSGAKQ